MWKKTKSLSTVVGPMKRIAHVKQQKLPDAWGTLLLGLLYKDI